MNSIKFNKGEEKYKKEKLERTYSLFSGGRQRTLAAIFGQLRSANNVLFFVFKVNNRLLQIYIVINLNNVGIGKMNSWWWQFKCHGQKSQLK